MTEWYATLRFRIILIVVISVLPALGLVLCGGLEQRRLAGLEARQEALQLARQASLNQKNLITETHHLLSMIAERQAARNGQWEECSAFMASLLSEFSHYLNFGVIDLEGNLQCSALPYSGTVSATDRTYFQRVLQTGDFSGLRPSPLRISLQSPCLYPFISYSDCVLPVFLRSFRSDRLHRLFPIQWPK
ncbi:MAG: hypothetical protein K9N21_00550 [Deltaproteobacteria bacterium]|nr:hypothetical protein [Deltaproteobacteria bacterium]